MAASKSSDRAGGLLDELLPRCNLPPPGDAVAAAFSGGPDSTALIAIARRHGCEVTAHHVDHGIRATSAAEADRAREIAAMLAVPFVLHRTRVEAGPNLEARARAARRRLLPASTMTGHTADDQAETLVLRLLRGSGATGLSAIEPGPLHPILALRRSETRSVCRELGITPVRDESNELADRWRNRVRAELLPLAADIAGRDVVPILARTARLLRSEDELLERLSGDLDATDARELAAADPVLARRAVRRWLTEDGYPPDAAAVDRVLAVARGDAIACELSGGRRLERSGQRFRIVADRG